MAAFNKAAELQNLLNSDIIDVRRLKQLCFHGCTDTLGIRGLCWKLLLNYLPETRKDWRQTLESSRSTYYSYVQQFILNTPDNEAPQAGEDHPLSVNPQSKWAGFFKDNELLLQINRDCRRLYPELNFFQQTLEVRKNESERQDSSANRVDALRSDGLSDAAAHMAPFEALRRRVVYSTLEESAVQNTRGGAVVLVQKAAKRRDSEPLPPFETHWEVVQRILYVFAKLNPGVAYVQGMNELVGPIYFVFAADAQAKIDPFAPSDRASTAGQPYSWRACEADTFFCFSFLMAEVRDFFIKTLDNSKCGIGEEMRRLFGVLRRIDEQLYTRLVEEQNVKPEFFVFRWLTLLLSQEFTLPDVIRLWDALFADEHRFKFLHYFCVSMLQLVRDTLLNGDFNENMHLLQNYQNSRITLEEILINAEKLYMTYELSSGFAAQEEQRERDASDQSRNYAHSLGTAADAASQEEAADDGTVVVGDQRNRNASATKSSASLSGMFRKNKK